MRSLIYVVVSFFLLMSIPSCGKNNKCGDEHDFRDAYNHIVLFSIVFENTEQPTYNNPVRLLKADGNQANSFDFSGNNRGRFAPVERTDTILGKIYERDFFFYITQDQDGIWDIDTIKTTYVLNLEECNNIWFEDFTIAYNDSIYPCQYGAGNCTYTFLK